MAKAASGLAVRFITLTVNPNIGASPEERLHLLARAWRVTVKRLRRHYGKGNVAYLAIVEETKRGEPHLHILFRGPYIPQAYLSACMGEIIDSPIVDIRKIGNAKEVIRYVAKYITKAPAQFGTAKRYWCSRDWEAGERQEKSLPDTGREKWKVLQRPILDIIYEWANEGFASRAYERDILISIPIQRRE